MNILYIIIIIRYIIYIYIYVPKMHAYLFQAEKVFVGVVLYAKAFGLPSVTDLLHSVPVHMLTVHLLQIKLALQKL